MIGFPGVVDETFDARFQPVGGFGAGCADAPPPIPDPFDDADALSDLEDRILSLGAHIEAAGQRMLRMIAEFDRRRGWELGGHASCAHWLAVRAGLDAGTAREKVRVARALEELPLTSAWYGLGRLTFSQVRALTRVATPDDEAELLEAARGCTVAQVERMVRGWRMRSAADALAREEVRQQARTLSIAPDLDGMYRVTGRLTPEQGAILMRALDAASDQLFREETPGQAYPLPRGLPEGAVLPGEGRSATRRARDTQAAAARRRADALALLAELALEAEAEAEDGPRVSGLRAARVQVRLNVELAALRAGDPTSGSGCSHLEDGVRVSGETSRRLACDASVVPLFRAPDGRLVDVGVQRRVVSPALRRALEARDGGCRFPGCGLRHAEAHHIRHWADGGETSLENCVLICRHHHRLLHEGGWRMQSLPGGRLEFRDPRGGLHHDARPLDSPIIRGLTQDEAVDPVGTLVAGNARAGVRLTSMGERILPAEGGGRPLAVSPGWERPLQPEEELDG
jgi:hypothetical protein